MTDTPQLDPLEPNEWGKRLQDAILDNSKIRDGLHDDEAQPLIDWGLDIAKQVTLPLADMPTDEAEIRYEELYGALPRLMTRLTWVAVYREKKGDDWTIKTIHQLNEMNQILHGTDAPQISEGAMKGYANQLDGLSKGDLVKALMETLTPNLPTTIQNDDSNNPTTGEIS